MSLTSMRDTSKLGLFQMMSEKTRNKLIEGPGLLLSPLPGNAAGSPLKARA